MCEPTYVPRGTRAAIPRPRWGRLYGVVLLGVAGLTVADIASPAVARPSLETVVVLVTFVAVALWVRGSRVALDQHAWCECAADTVTVRVIPSRRPVRASEVVSVGIAVVGDLGGSVIEKEWPARVVQHATFRRASGSR